MSRPQQISISDLREWLRRETASILGPLQSKGTKLLDEVRDRIEDTLASIRRILNNSEREVEKANPKTYRYARNANKFARNLEETVEALETPKEINYQRLYTFHGELEKMLASLMQQRREGYPYITPYFIFDRRRLDVSLKRLMDIRKELNNFLTAKYVKAKTVEDMESLIDRLRQTLDETKKVEENRKLVKARDENLRREIADVQQKTAQIRERAELNELMVLDQRIKELKQNVKYDLRHLQKPFFKLQRLARGSEVAIPIEEARKLAEYMSDPFHALANEEEGHPLLRNILTKLAAAMANGQLKLKRSRLRKAQEQIDNILKKDSLAPLQKRCTETRLQRQKLSTSSVVKALQSELVQLQNQLRELHKEKEFLNSRSKVLKDQHRRMLQKTKYLKEELEKTILQLLGKNIQVTLTDTE